MFTLFVSSASVAVEEKEVITAGRVGLQCSIRFSPDWDGLVKTAVFDGAESRDVIVTGERVTIPAECLAAAGDCLKAGFYGKSTDGAVVIPTVWASLGMIEHSVYPSGREGAAPTPDVVAQIQQAAANAEELARSVREDADLGRLAGPAGSKGEKGDKGDAGPAGETGGWYTPAVTQPTENTMQVSFTPSKTTMPAVSGTKITLPAGAKGATGSKGDKGADGKSAYDYAVEGGYTGTEEELAAKLAQDMPTTLPNPNALTFTGAVTGSYDGSEPVTVEIPQGGGGLSDYELIDTLDWSTEELAQLGAGKEYSFEEIQDICLVYTELANDTTTVSGLNVVVNNITLSSSTEPVSGKSGTPMNGYVFLRAIPGIGLFSLKSPGATTSNTYTATNAQIAYNLHPVTGKITQFKIHNRAMGYCTNTGILKIYVR